MSANADYPSQLEVLDNTACSAIEAGNYETAAECLNEMCAILKSAPELHEIPLSTVRLLLEDGRGHEVVTYLECLLQHILSCRHVYGAYYVVVVHLLAVYRSMGRTSEDILDLVARYEQPVADLVIRDHYRRAVSRAQSTSQTWDEILCGHRREQ